MANTTPRTSGSQRSSRAKDRAADALKAKLERIERRAAAIQIPDRNTNTEELLKVLREFRAALTEG